MQIFNYITVKNLYEMYKYIFSIPQKSRKRKLTTIKQYFFNLVTYINLVKCIFISFFDNDTFNLCTFYISCCRVVIVSHFGCMLCKMYW